jgi:hypothetical protein
MVLQDTFGFISVLIVKFSLKTLPTGGLAVYCNSHSSESFHSKCTGDILTASQVPIPLMVHIFYLHFT